MRPPDDERFTDLDRPPRGRRPPRRWTGTAGQRARASRRLPQAVFKITSYSRSGGAVHGRFAYITRADEAEAEGPNGDRLDQAALAARAAEWSEEAEARHTRQYAMSAILSFPADVDEEKATEAARQFLREAFADNHDYVFCRPPRHQKLSYSFCGSIGGAGRQATPHPPGRPPRPPDALRGEGRRAGH